MKLIIETKDKGTIDFSKSSPLVIIIGEGEDDFKTLQIGTHQFIKEISLVIDKLRKQSVAVGTYNKN